MSGVSEPSSISGRSTIEWVLSIPSSSKCNALSEHSLSTSILANDIVAMLSELKVIVHWRVLFAVHLFGQILLEQDSLQFNVTIIENQPLRHKLLQ